MQRTDNILKSARLIFWDFDGVVKDSVNDKTLAYVELFSPFGADLASRVRQHHERHGGLSRYEKIPLYLDWANEQVNQASVEVYCERFSKLVLQAVIDSKWVPGVREYLLENFSRQKFVLVTATPQGEIERIIDALDIAHCFHEVYGAPVKKDFAIASVLSRLECTPNETLMIGDSESDLLASRANSVPFLLRRTAHNLLLQATYVGPVFDGLDHE